MTPDDFFDLFDKQWGDSTDYYSATLDLARWLQGWQFLGRQQPPSMAEFNSIQGIISRQAMYLFKQLQTAATQRGITLAKDDFTSLDKLLAKFAPLDTPIFTGAPRAPTPLALSYGNEIATTRFVADAITGASGRLLKITTFAAPTGTFTAQASTKTLIVEVQGGGGGGGAAQPTGASAASCGGGGASGAYVKALLTAAQVSGSVPVVVGNGGSGGSAFGPYSAQPGGSSSFGGLVISPGGGGASATISTGVIYAHPGNGYGNPTAASGSISAFRGQPGTAGFCGPGGLISGVGAPSPFGSGGGALGAGAGQGTVGESASGRGAGGGGAVANSTGATGYNGGQGGYGYVVVYEYA